MADRPTFDTKNRDTATVPAGYPKWRMDSSAALLPHVLPFYGTIKENGGDILWQDQKKYKIKLTDDELKEFKSVIRKNKTSKTIRCRCQIIIDLDESHGKVLTHEQSAKSNGVCLATVTNTVKKYFEGGIDAVTEFKRNVNSDNARRVLDGRAEARIIELACGPVPEGHSRWTIRLLEEKSKIVLDTPVSREAIRRALKKTNFDLTKTTTGASQKR